MTEGKKDIADHLMARVALIGHSVSGADHPPARGWPDFDHESPLVVSEFRDAGATLWYARPGTRSAINLYHIATRGELRDKKTVIIPIGKKQPVAGAKITIENWDSVTPSREKYESGRSAATRREDVEFKNFTESVETSFKAIQGSDTAQFKFEQEVKVGFQANHGDETHEERSTGSSTVTGAEPTAAPGCDALYWRTWINQKSKVRHTGICEVDFAFNIGTRARGKGGRHLSKFEKHKSKYIRHIHFDSFWEDFIPMLKGEGRRDHNCYRYFRYNPAPAWLIREITAPLDLPFVDESPPFDDFAEIVGHKETIKGPNPEVLKKIRQYTEAGADVSIT